MYKTLTRFLQRRRERGFESKTDESASHEVPSHLRRAFQTGEIVMGKVDHRVNGGFLVSLDKWHAFCPASEMYPRGDERDSGQEGSKKVEFIILRIGMRNIVVSRRKAASMVALRKARAALARGTPLVGRVETIVPYGVFIDLGGVTGLLHISQALAHGSRELRSFVNKGDELEVLVSGIDVDRQRISLAVKTPLDMLPHPRKSRNGSKKSSAQAPKGAGRVEQTGRVNRSRSDRRSRTTTEWEKRWKAEWQADPAAVPQKVQSIRAVQGGRPDSNRRRH